MTAAGRRPSRRWRATATALARGWRPGATTTGGARRRRTGGASGGTNQATVDGGGAARDGHDGRGAPPRVWGGAAVCAARGSRRWPRGAPVYVPAAAPSPPPSRRSSRPTGRGARVAAAAAATAAAPAHTPQNGRRQGAGEGTARANPPPPPPRRHSGWATARRGWRPYLYGGSTEGKAVQREWRELPPTRRCRRGRGGAS